MASDTPTITDVNPWTADGAEHWCPEHGWGCHCDAAGPAAIRWQHTIDPDLLTAPALGAHLQRNDVTTRRAAILARGAWWTAVTRADHHARHAAACTLIDLGHALIRNTSRPDVAADELRRLATQLHEHAHHIDAIPAGVAHTPDPEAA